MSAIAQTVCAFLNTEGGFVIAGVNEDGEPNGSATEGQSRKLNKFLREKITPRVLYDVSFDRTTKGKVISLGVPAGPDRPYVYEGAVFTRKGTSTQPATPSALRDLVGNLARTTLRWERRPSIGLELDGVDNVLCARRCGEPRIGADICLKTRPTPSPHCRNSR